MTLSPFMTVICHAFRLSHRLQFEGRDANVIDVNVDSEDRYTISDPRNPLTKRRREASKQAMKGKK